MSSKSRGQLIECLEKRRDWLSLRIREGKGVLTFDVSERSALDYAIHHLISCPADYGRHTHDFVSASQLLEPATASE